MADGAGRWLVVVVDDHEDRDVCCLVSLGRDSCAAVSSFFTLHSSLVMTGAIDQEIPSVSAIHQKDGMHRNFPRIVVLCASQPVILPSVVINVFSSECKTFLLRN